MKTLKRFAIDGFCLGAFGRVVGAYNKNTNQEVAVKIIQKRNCDPAEMERINGETQILYKLNHVSSKRIESCTFLPFLFR